MLQTVSWFCLQIFTIDVSTVVLLETSIAIVVDSEPYLSCKVESSYILYKGSFKTMYLLNAITPVATKSEKVIFSLKVKSRSLTLVSFERASLVECACHIWSLYFLRFKSYKQRLKLTTDRPTDGTKTICPLINRSGGIKSLILLSSLTFLVLKCQW